MARTNRTVFELKAGSLAASDLEVTLIAGTEAISEPFEFTVELYPVSQEPLALADLLDPDTASRSRPSSRSSGMSAGAGSTRPSRLRRL
jgi:uncharacterized protein involved in type VI secretion and phage assembly